MIPNVTLLLILGILFNLLFVLILVYVVCWGTHAMAHMFPVDKKFNTKFKFGGSSKVDTKSDRYIFFLDHS